MNGHLPPAVRPRQQRQGYGIALLIVGGAGLVLWAIVPHIPIPVQGTAVSTLTLQQLHGLCSSALGQFGQLLVPAVARDCGYVGLGYGVLAVLFWGGLVLTAVGALTLSRR